MKKTLTILLVLTCGLSRNHRHGRIQQEDPQIAISADRVSMLENGDIDYSVNVIIRSKSTDPELQETLTPGKINHRPDGSTFLEGTVRI